MTTTAQDPTASPKIVSTAKWKANKRHTVTLPSNTVIEIEIPDLPNLVKTGTIPNELVDIAIGVAGGKAITKKDIEQQADFYNKLCALTVVAPAVTEEDFASDLLPFEDKEMIVEMATRQRDIDAIGHHLAGLEKVKDWRTFRGLSLGYEDDESV